MSDSSSDIVQIVEDCQDRAELSEAMKALFAELDEAIARHKPTCWNHGDCCKFGSYGHRLYVTSLELAYFREGHGKDWRAPDDSNSCPHQIDGLCTARSHRPLGCRVFFCDPSAQHWQGPVYEEYLARIKALGTRLGVEYRYLEWLSALGEWPQTGADIAPVQCVDPMRPGVIELNVLN